MIARGFLPFRQSLLGDLLQRSVAETFGFGLRSRFPELGRAADFAEFWQGCLAAMPLSGAMAWLDLEGVVVP